MTANGTIEMTVKVTIEMSVEEANDLLCNMRQYFGGGYRGEREGRVVYNAVNKALGSYAEEHNGA